MRLSKPQQTISNCDSRFRVVVAGRRFGKTFLAINELAKFARYPNRKCLYIATTYRQAKNVIWEDLKEILYSRNWIQKVNESDLTVSLVNGSSITLRSSENRDSLRGTKYDFISLDEFADMHFVMRPPPPRSTLSDTGGHALFIGSPKGRNHFYDLWLQGSGTPDWSSHSYTTLEGGFVPETEIQAAKRDLDERTFQQEYEAQFVNYSSVIFYAFTEKNVCEPEIPYTATTPLHIGMDFGVDPMSAVVCVKHYDRLHVIDEIEVYGSNTLEMIREIRNRYGDSRQMFVYPDASGKNRHSSSPGISDHIHLKNNGFILKAPNKNPPVAEAIATVNSLLKSASGEHRLTIAPKCRKLLECMNKFVYKEGTRQPDKGEWDHMTDALKYVCYMLFPLKTAVSSRKPNSMNRGQFV